MKKTIYLISLLGFVMSCHQREVEPPEPTDNATLVAGDYKLKKARTYFSADVTKYCTGSLHITRVATDSVKATYTLLWSGSADSVVRDHSFVEILFLTNGNNRTITTLGTTFGDYKDGQLSVTNRLLGVYYTFEK